MSLIRCGAGSADDMTGLVFYNGGVAKESANNSSGNFMIFVINKKYRFVNGAGGGNTPVVFYDENFQQISTSITGIYANNNDISSVGATYMKLDTSNVAYASQVYSIHN